MTGEVARADLVFLAVPVRTILNLIGPVSRAMRVGAILTDLGSTKAEIARIASRDVPDTVRFVGGHPFTGSERSGIDNADPHLYQNAVYVLEEPSEGRSVKAVRVLERTLGRVGARVVTMTPHAHDRAAALISHLPRVLAVALTLRLAGDGAAAGVTAGGFRDMTRIASSPVALWAVILATNADDIGDAVDGLLRELSALRERLRLGMQDELEEAFGEATRVRGRLPSSSKGLSGPFPGIQAVLPDRPGALADVARTLAAERINIRDIETLRIREGVGGTFRLAFEDLEASCRAAAALRRLGLEVWGTKEIESR
jgi:prephenate dehydrogenase